MFMKQNTKPPLNTATLLALQYQSPVVKLEDLIDDYLPHLSLPVAKKMAREQKLPFPVFKSGESNKAPWMVSIFDLAAYIDRQRSIASHDHTAMSG